MQISSLKDKTKRKIIGVADKQIEQATCRVEGQQATMISNQYRAEAVISAGR